MKKVKLKTEAWIVSLYHIDGEKYLADTKVFICENEKVAKLKVKVEKERYADAEFGSKTIFDIVHVKDCYIEQEPVTLEPLQKLLKIFVGSWITNSNTIILNTASNWYFHLDGLKTYEDFRYKLVRRTCEYIGKYGYKMSLRKIMLKRVNKFTGLNLSLDDMHSIYQHNNSTEQFNTYIKTVPGWITEGGTDGK